MGRGGHAFLEHWHRRSLVLPDGSTLRWTLMSNPRRAPHAECFRLTAPDGTARGVHPSDAARLLREHGHPDADHVPTGDHVGRPFTH